MALRALPPLEEPAAGPEARPGTDDRLIYAVGDIHGCYGLFRRLLTRCWEDSRGHRSQRPPMLVLCGDYVDRGPASAEVLEAVVQLKDRSEFELRALKGNHEEGMLAFLDDPVANRAWLLFGGDATLASYGVSPPGPDLESLERVRDELLERLPLSHLEFLRGLETLVVQGDYAFVHAGVRPGVPLEAQSERDLLWIRDDFLRAPPSFDKVIVHGHTWVNEHPQTLRHRIGLDTGAYATAVLTAVRLDAEGRAFLQVSD
jgi:serine/threonine protein phosphatase 1